jgi:diacylglycerol kinase family enzyme
VSRAVLLVNPYSSGVTRTRVADVAATLARNVELVVRQTEHRGHAIELAAAAADEADALLVFSGDGTYNEAINGAAGRVPFGFLPGGGASVLARALGMPRDPVAAASRIAKALEAGRTRSIGLGKVNGRRFAFSSGIGPDAAAVRRIDERGRDRDGRRAGNAVFAATFAELLLGSRFRSDAQIEIAGVGRAAFVFVANGRPYTYAGRVAVTVAGEAEFAGGLDFVAPLPVDVIELPALVLRGVRGKLTNDSRVLTGHDLDRIEVHCDRPLPLQADGEDLGDVTEAVFEAERNALDVLL